MTARHEKILVLEGKKRNKYREIVKNSYFGKGVSIRYNDKISEIRYNVQICALPYNGPPVV